MQTVRPKGMSIEKIDCYDYYGGAWLFGKNKFEHFLFGIYCIHVSFFASVNSTIFLKVPQNCFNFVVRPENTEQHQKMASFGPFNPL